MQTKHAMQCDKITQRCMKPPTSYTVKS